jgi:radical SAM superfamily enzyme YgiQ (UPF0313 family)
MKICLVTSPRFNCKPTHKTMAPGGLACLAAVARQAGHEVFSVCGILTGIPRLVAEKVSGRQPDVVGISTTTIDRFAGIETIRQIRQACPRAFIVAGGSHFSNTAADALTVVKELDAVVVGEGEETFIELLESFPGRGGFGAIRGLAWRYGDGQVVCNEPRAVMEDINHLPMPAWDLFDIGHYDYHTIHSELNPVHGMMTSRGCPQSCVFCANSLNKKMRFLDVSRAVDELQWLHKTYGVKAMDIRDDNFLTRPSHAEAICQELLRRDCRFAWSCRARPANLDPEMLKLMKRSGCKAISFGVESGSDGVLAAMRKGTTTAQIRQAMEIVAQVGFDQVGIFLITGLPGETLETIDQSVAFAKSIRRILGKACDCDSPVGQLPLIYPGTELEQIAKTQGKLPEQFSWNSPYLEPKRYLPMINHRYKYVPHFESASLPLESICRHLRKHYWADLPAGRKRRFRLAPLRRMKAALGLD